MSAIEDIDEATRWALAARHRDPVAEAAFVRLTHADVWRFVATLVDVGVADDLTQETYLRAFRALPQFEGRSSARTWLLGIAKRTCADHLRAIVRQRRLARKIAVMFDDESAPDASSQVDATQLLSKLSPERRACFVLTQILGLTYEQAAAALDVPVGTVRSRVARARADLVAELVTPLCAPG